MSAKNKKSRFMLITTLSGALLTGGIVFAGEKGAMGPSPGMTFSLQTQIQEALNLQIEQGVSDALAKHQVYVNNTHQVEKSRMSPGTEIHSQLSAGLVTVSHSASQ